MGLDQSAGVSIAKIQNHQRLLLSEPQKTALLQASKHLATSQSFNSNEKDDTANVMIQSIQTILDNPIMQTAAAASASAPPSKNGLLRK
jgi:hypothetical protein